MTEAVKDDPKDLLAKVNQEYSNLAAEVGHQALLIKNTHEAVEKAQDEMEAKMVQMTQLRAQAEKLQVIITNSEATAEAT